MLLAPTHVSSIVGIVTSFTIIERVTLNWIVPKVPIYSCCARIPLKTFLSFVAIISLWPTQFFNSLEHIMPSFGFQSQNLINHRLSLVSLRHVIGLCDMNPLYFSTLMVSNCCTNVPDLTLFLLWTTPNVWLWYLILERWFLCLTSRVNGKAHYFLLESPFLQTSINHNYK